MHIVAETEPLADAATFAARHTAGGVPIPALAGLRIATLPAAAGPAGTGPAGPAAAGAPSERIGDSPRVRLSGYDYEGASTVDVEVEVREPGEVLLPGAVFAEILRALPPGRVEVRTRGSGVDIVTEPVPGAGPSAVEFALPALPLDDYPALPATPPTLGALPAEAFGAAVARMTRIAARRDAVPIFSGTLLELEPRAVTVAASDRYRLAICEVDWAAPVELATTERAVVSARLLADTVKGLDPKGDWRLGLSGVPGTAPDGGAGESLLGLADDRRSTTLRLLDGAYPPMRSKVPTGFVGSVTVRADELRTALRRQCLVADRFAGVAVTFDADGIELRAAGDVDTRGRERLAARLDGDGTTTAFNASYLLDGLDFCAAEEVRIAYQEGIRPALLTSADAAGATDSAGSAGSTGSADAPGSVPGAPGSRRPRRARYVVLPRRLPSG